MSDVLTYIQTHTLPAKVWLNGLDSSSFATSNTELRWKNQLLNPAYDFRQTDPTLAPSIGGLGVQFTGNKRFNPVMNNLLVGASSYTVIFQVNAENPFDGSLLGWRKLDSSKPQLLEYGYEAAQAAQQFSLLNLLNELRLGAAAITDSFFSISHNIRYGKSRAIVGSIPTIRFNSDRGYLSDNFFGEFYLGSTSNTPLNGTLQHMLLFTPEIDDIHINAIASLLPTSTTLSWDALDESGWNSLDTAIWDGLS
ncbi:hypothetical protein [Chroococcidiopsis sp.]|uniref:hypothetical protein n=1 Tax=Chroococcidiopsis sp. TaxID=3088168 RepID=UPI003F3A8FCC